MEQIIRKLMTMHKNYVQKMKLMNDMCQEDTTALKRGLMSRYENLKTP